MTAALVGLQARSDRRKFALLGEMLELGDGAPAFHRELAGHTVGLDGVFCVGPGMRILFEALPAGRGMLWTPEADDTVTDALIAVLQPGDVLLVKGSNRVFWARDYVPELVWKLSSK
jgi:UDP-N-acetylmuramoyl-tripeptide--D-alanyl-D-alanine ligase